MSFPSITDQNKYQGTVLKLIAKSTKNLIIDFHVTELYGDQVMPCSIDVKDTLETITVQKNSKLTLIQSSAFQKCSKLLSADFSLCNELIGIDDNAFLDCTSLHTVALPKSKLESLGASCFSNTNLKGITIPDTVINLGNWLCKGCGSLATFTFEKDSNVTFLPKWIIRDTQVREFCIPKSVTELGNGVFEMAMYLETITIEKGNTKYSECVGGVKTIDGKKFITFPPGKTGEVTIPEGIEEIYQISFGGSKLSKVHFPNTLKKIMYYAFSNAQLTEIIIPDNVTFIDSFAFTTCSKATKLKLSENLTTINDNAFWGCAFSEVVIPHKVTTIGKNCFAANPHLMKIVLPESVTSIGGNVFPNNPGIDISFGEGSNLKFDKDRMLITDLQNTFISQYMGDHENLNFSVDSSIKTIKSSAFALKKNLIGVTFKPGSILTTIEEGAFSSCSNLKTFEFPDSLQIIRKNAFASCVSLSELRFGSQLNTIDDACFASCTNVGLLDLSASKVSIIPIDAFLSCENLETAKLPTTVTTFSSKCFYLCKSLSNLNIPSEAKIATIEDNAFSNTSIASFIFNELSTITEISSYAFANCGKLESVTFCPSITTIKSFAFASSGLKSVSLTKEIAKLEDRCFIDCVSITSIEIPSESQLSEDTFGVGAFGNCYSLNDIKCNSENFSVFVGALFSRDLKSLILFPSASDIAYFPIPEQVTRIGNGAFLGCKNLYSVIIPSINTTYIGISAFEGCSKLHYINIPDKVEYIGEGAFRGCVSLTCGVDVRNSALIPNLVEVGKLRRSAFRECNKITPVPCKPFNSLIRYNFVIALMLIC